MCVRERSEQAAARQVHRVQARLLPPTVVVVYSVACSAFTPHSLHRALDCPLTEVSHLYVKGGCVWFNSVTSTSTDQAASLAAFGSGVGGSSGTLLKIEVVNGRSVRAFSAFPQESELLLRANTSGRVMVALSSAEAALLQGMAKLPPAVDLVVLQEEC